MPTELPPSLEGLVRERNRDRVRVEVSGAQGTWLLGLITDKIKDLDIDSPDFQPAYLLYKSISDQIERNASKK